MSEIDTLSPSTLAQIEALDLLPRPLIICDVDEVLLHFLKGLENHLERSGYWLDAKSFALNGNIKHKDNDVVANFDEIRELIHGFFSADSGRLDAIDEARDSLAALASHAEIVLLTNLPEKFRSARIANLRGHGFEHPVVTNEGPKGPAARKIAVKAGQPVFFLDDAPNNVESVRDALPNAHIIHFVGDQRFLSLVDNVDGVHLRTGDWIETHGYIQNVLNAANGIEQDISR